MTTHTQFELGSVSTGTLRTEDLLPAFTVALMSFAPTVEPPETVDGLIEALQEHCPLFVFFGAHPGDGSDFGYFPDWDRLEEEKRYHEPHSKFWLDEDQCMVEFDGDNVTVKDISGNILWSTV